MDVEERLRLKIVEKEIKRSESSLKKIKKKLHFYFEIADKSFWEGLSMWFCRYFYVFLLYLAEVAVIVIGSGNSAVFWKVLIVSGLALFWLFASYIIIARDCELLLELIKDLILEKLNYEHDLKILKKEYKKNRKGQDK